MGVVWNIFILGEGSKVLGNVFVGSHDIVFTGFLPFCFLIHSLNFETSFLAFCLGQNGKIMKSVGSANEFTDRGKIKQRTLPLFSLFVFIYFIFYL